MKTSRYTKPPIIAILHQAEGGMQVADFGLTDGMMPLPGNGLSLNHERERALL